MLVTVQYQSKTNVKVVIYNMVHFSGKGKAYFLVWKVSREGSIAENFVASWKDHVQDGSSISLGRLGSESGGGRAGRSSVAGLPVAYLFQATSSMYVLYSGSMVFTANVLPSL